MPGHSASGALNFLSPCVDQRLPPGAPVPSSCSSSPGRDIRVTRQALRTTHARAPRAAPCPTGRGGSGTCVCILSFPQAGVGAITLDHGAGCFLEASAQMPPLREVHLAPRAPWPAVPRIFSGERHPRDDLIYAFVSCVPTGVHGPLSFPALPVSVQHRSHDAHVTTSPLWGRLSAG